MSAQELAALKRDSPQDQAEREQLKGVAPGSRDNPFRRSQTRRIADMGFDEQLLRQMSMRVREMTVDDLEAFAKRIAGVPTTNPRVNNLTVEDMQGIEALFKDQREQALATAAVRLGDTSTLAASSVDVSCCCCTPCCCCAATEVSPFSAQ